MCTFESPFEHYFHVNIISTKINSQNNIIFRDCVQKTALQAGKVGT